MRHLPDGSYNWILHCVDHWSKFNFAYPLTSKHAVGVSTALNSHIFPYFGVPRILHSDNGREFINKVIEELLKSWHTDIQLVSGRPRHPQSQGLVEREHYTLQRKLSAEICTVNADSPPWSEWLPRIVCKRNELFIFVTVYYCLPICADAMNIQVHTSTGSSPYELVFGQKPHSVLFPSENTKGLLLEEHLTVDGITVEDEPLNLTGEDASLEEEPKKVAEDSTSTGKRQLPKEEDDNIQSKRICLQVHGEETPADGGQGDERLRSLASTKKHLKVSILRP